MQRYMILARRAIPQYHKGCLVSNLMCGRTTRAAYFAAAGVTVVPHDEALSWTAPQRSVPWAK